MAKQTASDIYKKLSKKVEGFGNKFTEVTKQDALNKLYKDSPLKKPFEQLKQDIKPTVKTASKAKSLVKGAGGMLGLGAVLDAISNIPAAYAEYNELLRNNLNSEDAIKYIANKYASELGGSLLVGAGGATLTGKPQVGAALGLAGGALKGYNALLGKGQMQDIQRKYPNYFGAEPQMSDVQIPSNVLEYLTTPKVENTPQMEVPSSVANLTPQAQIPATVQNLTPQVSIGNTDNFIRGLVKTNGLSEDDIVPISQLNLTPAQRAELGAGEQPLPTLPNGLTGSPVNAPIQVGNTQDAILNQTPPQFVKPDMPTLSATPEQVRADFNTMPRPEYPSYNFDMSRLETYRQQQALNNIMKSMGRVDMTPINPIEDYQQQYSQEVANKLGVPLELYRQDQKLEADRMKNMYEQLKGYDTSALERTKAEAVINNMQPDNWIKTYNALQQPRISQAQLETDIAKANLQARTASEIAKSRGDLTAMDRINIILGQAPQIRALIKKPSDVVRHKDLLTTAGIDPTELYTDMLELEAQSKYADELKNWKSPFKKFKSLFDIF